MIGELSILNMDYSIYKQQRIVHLYCKCTLYIYLLIIHTVHVHCIVALGTSIVEVMKDEGLKVKVSAVCRLLRKYQETGNIARKLGLLTNFNQMHIYTLHDLNMQDLDVVLKSLLMY